MRYPGRMKRSLLVGGIGLALACAGVAAVFTLLGPSSPATPYERVRAELASAMGSGGPRDAIAILRSRITDPEVAAVCHALAHDIGRMAQETLGYERALETDDDICGFRRAGAVLGAVCLIEVNDSSIVGRRRQHPERVSEIVIRANHLGIQILHHLSR